MKKVEYQSLLDRKNELEDHLRRITNYLVKMRRFGTRHTPKLWLSLGYIADKPLTDEAQQGPIVTELYELVENARKIVKKA